jgi:hypothetical protein
LLRQFSEGETDAYHPSHRHMLQDLTVLAQQDSSAYPGLQVIQSLSATTQSTTKEVDNISSIGGHIASRWQSTSPCLPSPSQNFVFFEAHQATTKSVVNGKSSKPSSSSDWRLFFGFLTDCTSESATRILGSVSGSAEKLVIDANLNTGSFGGTYPNSTLYAEVCDIICVNATSDDDLVNDDQVVTSCSYDTNCTVVSEFVEDAVVGVTWKAIAPAVNITTNADISAKQYHNVDTIVAQQRLAAAKLSVTIGGTSVKFPKAAKLSKSGYVEHALEQDMRTIY